MPAFAMRTSIPPSPSTVPLTAASSEAGSVMSASNQTCPSPRSAATASRRSGSSPTSETLAPRAASSRAVASPMPRAAPVTRTALPATVIRRRSRIRSRDPVQPLLGGAPVAGVLLARGHLDLRMLHALVGNERQQMADAVQPRVALDVRVDLPPGRVRRRGVLHHDVLRLRVLDPAPPGLHVHVRELPPAQGIVDPALEAALLLLVRDREPVLHDLDAGPDEHPL